MLVWALVHDLSMFRGYRNLCTSSLVHPPYVPSFLVLFAHFVHVNDGHCEERAISNSDVALRKWENSEELAFADTLDITTSIDTNPREG